MKTKTLSIPLLLTSLLAAGGCATIVEGGDDTVTVDTRPPGAVCAIERDGATIAFINPTPGTISVEKSKDDLHVSCELEGYQPSVGVISSTFQPMTFGNIIFGGVIGVAVDAASGAFNDYPPLVSITMVPEAFASIEERDTFFDEMRDTFLMEADAVERRIRDGCDDPDGCERAIEQARSERQGKLDAIEAQRQEAVIR